MTYDRVFAIYPTDQCQWIERNRGVAKYAISVASPDFWSEGVQTL